MSLKENIFNAADWIVKSKRMIVFTGAGVSTDSGISDFRGKMGAWIRFKKKEILPKSPLWKNVKPNKIHYAFVELLKLGKLFHIISQNVDGLHIKSGIPLDRITELHGNHSIMRCINCSKKISFKKAGWDKKKFGKGYKTTEMLKDQPKCPYCGGRLINSILYLGDQISDDELYDAVSKTEKSDLLLVLGSSLLVKPAANLIEIASETNIPIIIINKKQTPYDQIAALHFFNDIAKVFIPIVEKVSNALMGHF